MDANGNVQTLVQSRILALLKDLPPESLTLVERFAQFLRDQVRRGQPVMAVAEQEERPPYLYPTILVQPSSLGNWQDLALEGYEGDALADTEALYDEV